MSNKNSIEGGNESCTDSDDAERSKSFGQIAAQYRQAFGDTYELGLKGFDEARGKYRLFRKRTQPYIELAVDAAQALRRISWNTILYLRDEIEMAGESPFKDSQFREIQTQAFQDLLKRCISVCNENDWESTLAVDVPLPEAAVEDRLILYLVKKEMGQRGKTVVQLNVVAGEKVLPVLRLISPYGPLLQLWALRFDKRSLLEQDVVEA